MIKLQDEYIIIDKIACVKTGARKLLKSGGAVELYDFSISIYSTGAGVEPWGCAIYKQAEDRDDDLKRVLRAIEDFYNTKNKT